MCWDNAWEESVGATLTNEIVHQMVYPARAKSIHDIASWIKLEHTITNNSAHPRDTVNPTKPKRSAAA